MSLRTVFNKMALCVSLVLLVSIDGYCETPLVFVSAPDWHNVDNYMQPSFLSQVSDQDLDFTFSGMASVNPSIVIMPGDLGFQHWWDKKLGYQAICAPGGDLKAIIMGCAEKSYRRLLNKMSQHGLNSVYVALGDHEIGDNDWPLGVQSDSVPIFKAAFAKYFTQNTDGTSKFNGMLNGVPMRPIGTAYENTSYAFRAGNTLFVAVDQFQQISTSKVSNFRGTVKATVGLDGHISWLDNLLKAARNDASISHIIVFGHLPVLSPVRSVTSSSIYLDAQQNSLFWATLRANKVDLYLAGEVHDNTVIKDRVSKVIQVAHVSGASGKSGFLVGRIYSARIELDKYIFQTSSVGQKAFVKEGTLVIDKSKGNFKYYATGKILQPIDAWGLIQHYSFDEDISKTVSNHGSFNKNLDGSNTNVNQITTGILKSAAYFTDSQSSSIKNGSMTPIIGSQARTISLWVQTLSTTKGYVYPAGKAYNPNGLFRLFVDNGVVGVQLDSNKEIRAQQGGLKLNNNRWHHLAVTFPGFGAVAADIRFYIDGVGFNPVGLINETIYTRETTFNVGGKVAGQPINGWTGGVDDFAMWASALTPTMINAIKSCGVILKYNASDMEALFQRFRYQSLTPVTLNGLVWNYRSGLSGTVGVCSRKAGSNSYSVILDSSGSGMATN